MSPERDEKPSYASLEEEVRKLRRALSFAASAIKSGEPWSETCEKEIGAVLHGEAR